MLTRSFCAAVLLLALSAPAIAGTATPAANVTLVTGRATASATAGGIRPLAKGDAVYSGEIVHSSANSYVDLKFSDGGYFLLRPNSRFQVVDFANHSGTIEAPTPPPETPPTPAPAQSPAVTPTTAPLLAKTQDTQSGASRAFFSLLKGGFRSISGLIGKINHDEYQVSTPVATIGIRGTDYLVVICDATCATDPQIVAVLPPGVNPLGGIVSTVYAHSIVVTDAGGTVTLLEGQYLLVLPDGTNILLPLEPHFLHIDPTPNPATCAG
jgi:hypothetical protein